MLGLRRMSSLLSRANLTYPFPCLSLSFLLVTCSFGGLCLSKHLVGGVVFVR